MDIYFIPSSASVPAAPEPVYPGTLNESLGNVRGKTSLDAKADAKKSGSLDSAFAKASRLYRPSNATEDELPTRSRPKAVNGYYLAFSSKSRIVTHQKLKTDIL